MTKAIAPAPPIASGSPISVTDTESGRAPNLLANREGERAGSVSALNFLELPLICSDGVEREDSTFRVAYPWALAGFGQMTLRQGWWRLDFQMNDTPGFPELRLAAPWDPLVVVGLKESSGVHIHIRGGKYQVAMLVSAWPGSVSFDRLVFRHVGAAGEIRLVAGMLSSLAARRRPLEALTRAARRALAGQAVGVRTSAPVPPTLPADPQHSTGQNTAPQPPRLLQRSEFTMVIQPGDLVHQDAESIVAREFARQPDVRAFCCDVDGPDGIRPHPCWDTELATRFPFPDSPAFLRPDAELKSPSLAAIAQRYGPSSIGRIPLPLVRRTNRPGETPGVARPAAPARLPRVSAIIPTKFRMDLLHLCLEGLARKTDYPDLQVIVIDNGVTDSWFSGILKEASSNLDIVKIEDFGSFNFSRLVNKGARKSSGDMLLLLNDDVVATETGWLHRMVDSAVRTDVGAVGARLVYPDGSIQHAGVTLGIGGVCGHLWKGLTEAEAASNPYVMLPGSRRAVTAACLAVRKEVFDEVSGLDEGAFPVAFNDIDFCLRLEARGYRNIYRGDTRLVHYESQSRGHDDTTLAKRRRLVRETQTFLARWGHLIDKDPYSSPAFDARIERGVAHPAARSAPEHYAEDKT